MHYQFSCAPELARKCEIEHWFPSGADVRAGGIRSGDYQFSGKGRFTELWGSARSRYIF